jgi:hypothetical protein
MYFKKILISISFLTITLFGADYSSMGMEDLLLQKGSIPEADREAFKSAMQAKMGSMSDEERNTLQKSHKGEKQNGDKMEKKDKTGGGNMFKGAKKSFY